jgi:hypothetical protein
VKFFLISRRWRKKQVEHQQLVQENEKYDALILIYGRELFHVIMQSKKGNSGTTESAAQLSFFLHV